MTGGMKIGPVGMVYCTVGHNKLELVRKRESMVQGMVYGIWYDKVWYMV